MTGLAGALVGAPVFGPDFVGSREKGQADQRLPTYFASDLMVWNVTKDAITTREAVFPDRVTPPPTTEGYKKAPRSGIAEISKYIMDGVWRGFEPPPLPEK